MAMELKLDTNALEKLLTGDDGKIKLKLQQAVVEEFGRRHIKAFVNDGAFGDQIKTIKQEAIKDIEAMFGEWQGNYSTKKFVLNKQIKDMVQMQAKTAVTYELDKVETYVEDLYKETARKIQTEYTKRAEKIETDLANYLNHLEDEAEKVKAKLITEEVDGILRNHIKSILAESFSVGA